VCDRRRTDNDREAGVRPRPSAARAPAQAAPPRRTAWPTIVTRKHAWDELFFTSGTRRRASWLSALDRREIEPAESIRVRKNVHLCDSPVGDGQPDDGEQTPVPVSRQEADAAIHDNLTGHRFENLVAWRRRRPLLTPAAALANALARRIERFTAVFSPIRVQPGAARGDAMDQFSATDE